LRDRRLWSRQFRSRRRSRRDCNDAARREHHRIGAHGRPVRRTESRIRREIGSAARAGQRHVRSLSPALDERVCAQFVH
jgi:hypothetical protein